MIRLHSRLLPFVLLALIPAGGCGSDDNGTADDSAAQATSGATAPAMREGDEHSEDEGARVTLGEAAYHTAQIEVAAATAQGGAAGSEVLEVPGQVEFDPRRVAVISPRAAGRIERLTVVEGDRVTAGQTVALLFSPAYVTAQNDLAQAARRAGMLEGTADAQGSAAILQAARRRLRTLGAGEAEIARIEGGGEPSTNLVLTAPFGGTIMETHSLPGEAVEAGEEIFRMADLSVVDVVAEVPERSLALVRLDQRATIGIAAFPRMTFAGRVERLRGELNPETRTVQAIIHALNPGGRLRPGMFATVRLAVPAGTVLRDVAGSGASAPGGLVTIPETAVVSDGDRRFVFVEVAPRTFERREVAIVSLAPAGSARPTANRIGVERGLAAGERVAVRGAFILKSELAKSELGEHGH